ncbi:DUF4275 family protein [Planomicrobium sp. CPCC 101110]|uniref:DUF4275 family protein n=1 Tax=Planomicrobium sp. CPCC 101110 TaxID=2599619 RepID=UPI0011B75893|nr:DUF4275 family protein [Planomicrobium sp. CPCC 101110]TWT26026.1 DUF4275 family protein [Planomicrobium sp. CPCC 101110]
MDEFIQTQTNRLQAINVGYEVVPNSNNEMEQRWEEAFAIGISKSQKRKLAFKQCMWNVFSWGKIKCLKEHQAKGAFDLQKKAGCYLICTSSEEAIFISKASRLKAKDITHIGSDLYIVDDRFTWTYVLTHEEDCGPYFYKP